MAARRGPAFLVWQFEAEELQTRLLVWRASSPDGSVTPRQLEELSNFFPDQFIMPSESWHWKLAWQVGGGSKRASNVDPYWILTGS